MHTKNFYLQIVAGQESVGFGFGETDRTYEERQKDSDYSKSHSSNLLFLGSKWSTYEWWESRTVIDRESGQDKEVHSFLNSIPGIEQLTDPDSGRKLEVFKFTKKGFGKHLTIDIVKDMINEKYFSKGSTKRENLSLREHQNAFVVKSTWQQWKEFLLFAKCRAGKTVMALSHTLKRNYKVTLVMSRISSAKGGWRDDIKLFNELENFVFIDLQDKENSKTYKKQIEYWASTDKQVVLFDTIQGGVKKNIPGVNFIIFDEAHIGSSESSKQWKKVRSKYDCPVLYVTGTAYKMVDDFSDANTFIYSYFEEQLDKKKGLNCRPTMELILAKYSSAEYQQTFGDDPDSLNNIFRVEGKDFTQPSLVDEFVSRFFKGDRRVRTGDRLLADSSHLYITLPSVAACWAFAEYLKGTRFSPLVVTGDSDADSVAISKHLEEHIEDGVKKGAAIITRTANVLGVTAKSIDTVINLSQGESIEFWTQFAFRGGSSDHNWKVIDFVPDRCLSSLREMFILSTDNEPELCEYEFTDFVNILEWDSGFSRVSHEQVVDIMAKDPRDTRRLISGLANGMNTSVLKDLNFTPTLKSSDDGIAVKKSLNENGTTKKSNSSRVTEREKGQTSEEAKLISHVKCILERLPIFILSLIQSKEVVDNLCAVTSHAEYISASGDVEGVLSKYCSLEPDFAKKLNNRINQLSMDLISAYKEDPIGTLEVLSVSDSESRQIPSKLFIDMCPTPKGKGDTLAIVYDPVGLHSTVAISLGWLPEQITVIDPHPRHLYSVKAVSAKINTIQESFLDLSAMQFDVIIGNPPYQDSNAKAKNNKLWHKFVNKAFELVKPGGVVSLVTPDSVIGNTGFGKKFLELCSTKLNMTLIDYSVDKLFNVGVGVCRWTVKVEEYSGQTSVVRDTDTTMFDLRQGLPMTEDDRIMASILDKVANSKHDRIPLKMGQAIAKGDYSESGKYQVFSSGNTVSYTDVIPNTGDSLKFIAPFSSSHKKRFISKGYVGMLNCWCEVTREQGERYCSIFDLPLIDLFISKYLRTSGFTPAIKNAMVPDVDPGADLAIEFDLTEEEVAHLTQLGVM
ncbi:type II restriction-modification system restriction subunit [Synechococcus phage MA10]